MKLFPVTLIAITSAGAVALAEERRDISAHAHGVSTLGVAIQGDTVQIELKAPGADTVGFEYEPKSAAEKSAVKSATSVLEKPLELFGVPAAAKCTVTAVDVHFEIEGAHDDHDDHSHGAKKHGHDDHSHGAKKAGHDDHDHGHSGDAKEESHAEFHAEYKLKCAAPAALDALTLTWFKNFPKAEEVEAIVLRDGAQIVTEATAKEPKVALKR